MIVGCRASQAAGEVTGQARDAQATLENPSNWETTRQGQGIWERVKSAVGAGSSDASRYAEDAAATAQVCEGRAARVDVWQAARKGVS